MGAYSAAQLQTRPEGEHVNAPADAPGSCYDRGMLDRVITGGQCGVDQAGLRAANAAGIPTGGTAPQGWATEDGPAPWLADFGLVECERPGYPPRTEANVRASQGTLWIGDPTSPGGKLTVACCARHSKTWLIVREGETTPRVAADWIARRGIKVLNVAGSRESRQPGIGERAEAFLATVFRITQRKNPGG